MPGWCDRSAAWAAVTCWLDRADEIRLAEILSAVDGPITLGDFGEPHQDGACDHEGQCVLLAVWKQAGEVMRRHLEGYTLATIADIARGEAPWPAPASSVGADQLIDQLSSRSVASRPARSLASSLRNVTRSPAPWMVEGELDGVQERSLDAELRASLAVHRIAHQWMVDRAQVDPDLMRAAGLEPALEQRQLGRAVVLRTARGTRFATVARRRRSPS